MDIAKGDVHHPDPGNMIPTLTIGVHLTWEPH